MGWTETKRSKLQSDVEFVQKCFGNRFKVFSATSVNYPEPDEFRQKIIYAAVMDMEKTFSGIFLVAYLTAEFSEAQYNFLYKDVPAQDTPPVCPLWLIQKISNTDRLNEWIVKCRRNKTRKAA